MRAEQLLSFAFRPADLHVIRAYRTTSAPMPQNGILASILLLILFAHMYSAMYHRRVALLQERLMDARLAAELQISER